MKKIIIGFVVLITLVSCQNPNGADKYEVKDYTYKVQTPQVLAKPDTSYGFVVEYRTYNAKLVKYYDFKGRELTMGTILNTAIVGFPLFYNDMLFMSASNPQTPGIPIYAEIWINGKLAKSAMNNGDTTSASVSINLWRDYVIENPIQYIQESFY